MSTAILSNASEVRSDVESIGTMVEALRCNVTDLITSQIELMERARDDLRASGVDAHIVRNFKSVKRPQNVGEVGILWERFYETHRELSFHVQTREDDRRGLYFSESGGGFRSARGLYEIVAIGTEDDHYEPTLIARTVDPFEEVGHKRAVQRLRTLARREHMRIEVRDREASLINPMNDVVYVGDVTGAGLWLLGVDLTSLKDVTW